MLNVVNIQKAYEDITEAVRQNDEKAYQRAKKAFLKAALDKAIEGKLFYVDFDYKLKAVRSYGGIEADDSGRSKKGTV